MKIKIMKRVVNISLLLFIILGLSNVLNAQKTEMTAKKSALTWEEAKEAYHHAMSSTFHPAEEGDFAPLKETYKDLATSAKAWKGVAIPESLSKDEIKPLLKKLYKESAKIGKLIEGGTPDEELKEAMYALHDVFHELVGKCNEH